MKKKMPNKKGMHKMSNTGHMMADKDMKPMMGGKKPAKAKPKKRY